MADILALEGVSVEHRGRRGVSRILDQYQLIRVPVDVYQISHVPFKVLPLDFTLVVLAAVAIAFLATIYPSRQAARLDPAQALRYE